MRFGVSCTFPLRPEPDLRFAWLASARTSVVWQYELPVQESLVPSHSAGTT